MNPPDKARPRGWGPRDYRAPGKAAPDGAAPRVLTLTISSVAYRGAGIARHEGLVVFVHSVLPGEVVEAEITRRKRNYAEARLLRVITPSPERISPACSLHGRCPGCRYQHATYNEELRLKQAQLSDFLTRTAGVPASVIAEPLAAPAPLGYRNRISLHAGTADDRTFLGYFAEDNRTLVEVTSCPIASDAINEHLAALLGKPGALARIGADATVTLRSTPADGTLMLASPSAESPIPYLTEMSPLGAVAVPRTSFFQVNAGSAALLFDEVRAIIRRCAPRFLIDLYCGVGLFSIAAVKDGVPEAIGIDSDPAAIDAAKQNAHALGATAATFFASPAEKAIRDAIRASSPADTMLVLDPPRAGLHEIIREVILLSLPSRILYVSCAADTLARDLKILIEGGYKVTHARLVDMFPRTALFESVVLLER